MSMKLRRLYSTNSAPSIPARFLEKAHSRPPHIHTQILDANQLQRLSATLARDELAQNLPNNGTPLPACYHLVYFTSSQLEEDLGPDGSDRTFSPPSPYTRRMWAGGELEWVSKDKNALKIGQEVTETTRLVSSVGKVTRTGEEMLVVGVEKTFENEGGLALVDKRNWIFRPEITTPIPPAPKPPMEAPVLEGKHVREVIQTPVSLFRFSALTFNGHKIHYNQEWCQTVEGHRDLVVHGPLNLINMINFWRDVRGLSSAETPKKVTYRATNPLYANEKYRIYLEDEFEKATAVQIIDSYGRPSMVGRIESF